MALVMFYDTNGVPQRVDVTNGDVHVLAKFADRSGNPQGLLIDENVLFTAPYYYAIADGLIPGHVPFERFGINSDIDISVEDVWSVGGTYVFPAAAQQMELVSTSAEDDPVKADTNPGTGIHTVTLYYLTSNFTEKTEDINLNGTGVVLTAGTDIFRVQALKAKVCGTGGQAAGTIDIRNTSDAPIYSRIDVGNTRSRNMIYTVPKNKELFITSIFVGVSCTAASGAVITLRAKYDHDVMASRTFFLPHAELSLGEGGVQRTFEIPLIIPSGVDIKCSASSLANNTTVNVSIRGWLE